MTMPDHWFQRLSSEDKKRYRLWATNNYKAGQYIDPMWHPVVRRECERINRRNEAGSNNEAIGGSETVEKATNEEV
jgi:hypothetical protein